MKKIILSIAILSAVSLPESYAAREKGEFSPSGEVGVKTILTPGETLGFITAGDFTYRLVTPPVSSPAVTRADEDAPTSMPITPVIYNAPGELHYYIKDVSVAFGSFSPYQALYGMASTIYWDGDDAYFKNIITTANDLNSYVKGSLRGDELVLPMNQTVKEFEPGEFDPGEKPYAVNFGLLRPVFSIAEETGELMLWYQFSDDYDSLSFKVDETGFMTLQIPEAKYDNSFPGVVSNPYLTVPPYAIGLYYNDDLTWSGWLGYCDWDQTYNPFNYEAPVVPDNLSWKTFTYKNPENLGVVVYVAETEDAVFFKGLSAYLQNSVFKADKLDNGYLSVQPGQFIGMEYDFYFVITNTGMYEKDKNTVYPAPEGEPALFIVERDDSGEIMTIKADPDSPYFLVFDDDPGYFFDMDSFQGLEINYQESLAATPSTPYDVEVSDVYVDWDTMGAYYIFFKLSAFGSENQVIDVNNLYYSIFVNGEPFEFEEEEAPNLAGEQTVMYPGIKEPTTIIPYYFNNGKDLYEDTGGTFIVAIYSEGVESIGVESVYKCDGVTTVSNLVTVELATGEQTVSPGEITKVETLSDPEISSVEYFDLLGNRIANPSGGLFVKRSKLSDGSVKTQKVLLR